MSADAKDTRGRTERAVEGVFGPDGNLSKTLEGYEERPQQRAMADAVARAFDRDQRALIEAATGTGKTVAYLVPAILSGQRTVVSTATKTLQEQIFQKDIPLLDDVLDQRFKAVYLKGRQNYLCLWQLEEFQRAPEFRRAEDKHWWPAVEKWTTTTKTGDRGEIAELPDDWATWSNLSIGADQCLGRECSFYNDCFVMRARQEAADANVIVVNHHLFFADLALRTREHAELLPAYEAVVFDEAHNLEETAASYFGVQISNYRVLDLLSDIEKFVSREIEMPDSLEDSIADTKEAQRDFFDTILNAFPDKETRVEWPDLIEGPKRERIESDYVSLQDQLTELAGRVEGVAGELGEIGTRLGERIETIQVELSLLVHRESTDLVYMAERRRRGVFLQAFPTDISQVLRDLLYSTCRTQVFTSATLSTDGNFRFFRARMGLPKEGVEELRLDPVFDYMNQALLYVPDDLPEPNDPGFVDKLAPVIEQLVKISDGRAFLLFTSYRNMNRAFELLVSRIKHRVLVQGQMSRAAILEKFREDTHSVLFATSSFWEGVDVQGESLSLVVIDKLPFASPFDPLVKARLRHIEEEGRNPFVEYQVPSAAIALKQGFGRLIRHRNDRGIIAILDSRLVKKSYGKRFISSLPRARRTRDLSVVQRWWESKGH